MAPRFRSFKQRGEWVELKFITEAIARGFHVILPYGQSMRYDLVIERDARFGRVQVKSTDCLMDDGYRCTLATHNGRLQYSAEQIDFLAAYVLPVDVWYIFPAEAIANRNVAMLYPHRKPAQGGMFEKFRDAWHLLLA